MKLQNVVRQTGSDPRQLLWTSLTEILVREKSYTKGLMHSLARRQGSVPKGISALYGRRKMRPYTLVPRSWSCALYSLTCLHLKHLRLLNKTHWEPQASMNNSEKWSWSKMNKEMETGLVWYHLPPSTGGFGEPLSKTSYVYANTLLYRTLYMSLVHFLLSPFIKTTLTS